MESALQELRRKRERIARIISTDFADQEVSLDRTGHYTIELDGEPRRFQLFNEFNPSLRTPEYDTPEHRSKRRRFNRLQNLCMAYTNATQAILLYERLLSEIGGHAEGVELLADRCIRFGEQSAQFFQGEMRRAKTAADSGKGGKATRFDNPESRKHFDDAVRFYGHNVSRIVAHLNKTKPSGERPFGRDAVKNELTRRRLIAGK